ncbi:MAG: MarR family transcriptional regulator [Flavobacteriales bacterium]|nr:MarR family transcriptional regulator [Flavobacteriales bacterium]MBK9196770.1 MarR family transcriptional regulator [Flavobacteriales bacterium]MBP6574880.1 MarR family transcriptional regulator [Flavobacteriales bacterium]
MATIEEEIKGKFESEQQKAMLNVMFTANWLKARHNALLAPFGLSVQQFNILRILRGAKGEKVNMHCVKERMIDRAPNATRLTDKLIAKGLVLRERCDEDKRVIYVRISTAGLELLEQLDGTTRLDMGRLHEGLSVEDARLMNNALDALRAERGEP